MTNGSYYRTLVKGGNIKLFETPEAARINSIACTVDAYFKQEYKGYYSRKNVIAKDWHWQGVGK